MAGTHPASSLRAVLTPLHCPAPPFLLATSHPVRSLSPESAEQDKSMSWAWTGAGLDTGEELRGQGSGHGR